jgi:hypothetical protein
MINFYEQCNAYLMLTLCLDVVLNLEDTSTNSKYQTLNMTELVAFDLENGPDGIHFPLVQTSLTPRQWKVEGSLKL